MGAAAAGQAGRMVVATGLPPSSSSHLVAGIRVVILGRC